MLILTRRIGEKLIVGGNVTVTVLGAKGNQIRMGIDAPLEVKVHREEVYLRMQNEKKERRPSIQKPKEPVIQIERKPVIQKYRKTLVLKPRKKLTGL